MSTTPNFDCPSISTEKLLADPTVVYPDIARALADNGSFLLRSTGADPVMERALQSFQKFLSLPQATKRAHHQDVRVDGKKGGWLMMREAPVYMSHMEPTEIDTLNPKEQFGFSVDLGKTHWPEPAICAGFTQSMGECARWLDDISKNLMGAFADVLHEDATFFKYEPGYLAFSRYPAQSSANTETIGLHEHSDAVVFTVLTQRTAALQLRQRNGDWFSLPPLTGDDLLVIAGDWMELWSNGRIRAVRHRVVDIAHDRLSVAFFQNVAKMRIGPLPAFVNGGQSPLYPTIESDIDYTDGDSGVPRWKTAIAASHAENGPSL